MSDSTQSPSWQRTLFVTGYLLCVLQLILWTCKQAYNVRLFAINEYGRVIHEFDPYFNYRATEYLWEHGWKKFATWFDYKVWYPLGRPVGTTIYPGMQVTSVAIKKYLLPEWSINDICCLVPAWFGVLATISVALLAYECSSNQQPFGSILNDIPVINVVYRSVIVPAVELFKTALIKLTGSCWGLDLPQQRTPALECAFFAAAIMAVVPAHIMRSVGGGYDNESVATTAMVLTFYMWTRSLRGDTPNYVFGVLAGVAYFYMVAAWGGYVFVLNLIGLHASILVGLGRYSTKLYWSYTLFYLVGTALAIRVPVVGRTPLKSLEQMGPLLAFVGFQLIQLCQIIKRRRQLSTKKTWMLRIAVFATAGVLGAFVIYFLAPKGYFGPISSRVRGLFIKHTKTGNPLVDSVAEHQPASADAYYQYLHWRVVFLVPIGFFFVALVRMNDSSSFLLVYAVVTYFFSHRMVRLILLTAPIASVLAGIVLGNAWAWCLGSVTSEQPTLNELFMDETTEDESEEKEEKDAKKSKSTSDKTKPDAVSSTEASAACPLWVRAVRLVLSVYLIYLVGPSCKEFYDYSWDMAEKLSSPSIIVKAQTNDGRIIMLDDYREAYWWLRDNTPEDARIMAWWDYGYQITGIANRTTIADGNTWNHEHIALLGRTLTSPEKEGHRIARHLADYVLVWAGGGGDDLAKSPHLARIANSVYRHMCPGDPTCRSFGFIDRSGTPSPKMAASLLYKLHSNGMGDVHVDKNRFKEVYKSKYGKVRIYKILSVSKESKEWVADPANRICDVEGGWFCRGQYPPALQKILKEKKDFRQLEDFNVDREHDDEYQKAYHANLNNPDKAQEEALSMERGEERGKLRKLPPEDIERLNAIHEDSEISAALYEIIAENDGRELRDILIEFPEAAHIRSKDGRGPMFWAHEFGHDKVVKLLRRLGVREDLQDAYGMTPLDISKVQE